MWINNSKQRVLFFGLILMLSTELNGQTADAEYNMTFGSDYMGSNFSDFYIEMADIQKYRRYLLDLYQDVNLWRDVYITFGNVFSVIGITLNGLCILIFNKSKLFRNSSFPYYVNILAIVDTLNIFFRFAIPQLHESYVRYILSHIYSIDKINTEQYLETTESITSEYHCSLQMYLSNSLTLISIWLMVAVSFERWFVIKVTIQSQRMIKTRAIICFCVIFISLFFFNIFDMAPGFYIKPTWFANLTMLCERDNTIDQFGNLTGTYKQLGPISFNTEVFALVRIVTQTVVPFLLVLYFNSLIIYNFKKIKKNAMNFNSQKTSPIHSHSCHDTSNKKKGLRDYASFKRGLSYDGTRKEAKSFTQNKAQLSYLCTPNRSTLLMSPPNQTCLVSALNLADNHRNSKKNSNPTIITKSMSPSDISESGDSTDLNQCSIININGSAKASPNKLYDNSFLMPPNFSSRNTNRNNNNNCDSSIATSSDKLSVATSSNLTATTSLNQTSSNNHMNVSRVSASEKQPFISHQHEPNSGTNCDTSRNSKCMHIGQMDGEACTYNGGKTKISTTQTSRKFFSKRRKKVKLNRETDIMLIVLSFSILISQMPLAIANYLIYYQNILDNNLDEDPFSEGFIHYYRARMPIVIYIFRLLEIIYFSLNFFFYITLSPTLRREIKTHLSSYTFFKRLFKASFSKDEKLANPHKARVTLMNNSKSHALEMMAKDAAIKSLIKNVHESRQKDTYSCSNGDYPDFTSNNNSLIEYDRTSQNHMNTSSLLNVNGTDQVTKRVSSNSSGEYFDFIHKLRSISPHKKYPCLLTDSEAKKANIGLFKLESPEEEDTLSFPENEQLVGSIARSPDYSQSKKASQIRIVINNGQ